MKAAIFLSLVFLLVALSQAKHTRWYELQDYTFEDYVNEYHKQYPSKEEYTRRQKLFYEKLEQINTHNKDSSQSYKQGVNQLTDLTPEEFKRILGHKKFSAGTNIERVELDVKAPPPPEYIDWRDSGIITAVKDQGQCGSCWAFSAVESMESFNALVTGQLEDLSIQQLLDCTSNPNQCGGTGGCNGATYELAWDTIQTLGGLASEWTYPYQSYYAASFPQCRFNSTTTPTQVGTLDKYVALPQNEYNSLVNAVGTVGPISISVDASTWSTYESGIFNGCNQTNPDINHAVQLVGYGSEKGNDYWLVRNSWAPSWGEDGYIKLAKSSKVECGVDITPLDGSGCLNGPPNVTVCGTCGILYEPAYPVITIKKTLA